MAGIDPWKINGEYVNPHTGDDMFEKLREADAEAPSKVSALVDWSKQQWDLSRQAVLDWWQGPPQVRLKTTEKTLQDSRLIFGPASRVNPREEAQRAFLKEVKCELSRIESLGKSGAPLSEDQLKELSRLTTDLEIGQSTRRPTEGSEEPMLIFSLTPRDSSRLPNGFSCEADWIPGGLDPMWMKCSYAYGPQEKYAKTEPFETDPDANDDAQYLGLFAPSDRGGGSGDPTPPTGESQQGTPSSNIGPGTVQDTEFQVPGIYLRYSEHMDEEGTMRVMVHSLSVNNAPYGGRSFSHGVVFGLMTELKKHALDKGASELVLFFSRENQRLDEFLSARYEPLPSGIPGYTLLRIPLGTKAQEFSALDGTEGLPDSVTYPTPMPQGHLEEGFEAYHDAGKPSRESFPAHESRPEDRKACDGVAKPAGIEEASRLPGFMPHTPTKQSTVSVQAAVTRGNPSLREADLMKEAEVIEISRLTQAQRIEQAAAGVGRSFSSFDFDIQPPPAPSVESLFNRMMDRTGEALSKTAEAVSQFAGSQAGQMAIGVAGVASLLIPQVQAARGAYAVGAAALSLLGAREARANETTEEESATPEAVRATGPSSLPSQHELSLSLSVMGSAASALNLQETMLGAMTLCVSHLGGLALGSVMPSVPPDTSADLSLASVRSGMENALSVFDRGRSTDTVASTFYRDMVRSSRDSAGQDVVLREAYRGPEINISGRSGNWGHWSRDTGAGISSGYYSSAGFGYSVRSHSSFREHGGGGGHGGGSDKRSRGPFGGRR
jgi:hypothetical protein